jgi:hypothetical protein
MTRVGHFDAVETERDHRLDALARAVAARVRPDRDAAGVVDQPDCVGDLQARFLDKRRSLSAEPAVERLSQVSHPAAGDECAGYVRTAHGSGSRLSHDGFHCDRDAAPIQRGNHRFGSRDTVGLESRQRRFNARQVVQMEAQDVDLYAAIIDRAQLDAGDDRDAIRRARGAGGRYRGDRVVVSDRNGCEAERGGLRQEGFGGRRAIGRRRVGVKINRRSAPLGMWLKVETGRRGV